MTTPNAIPANGGVSDARLWELRREAKDDPRTADEHWFILFARAAIAEAQSRQPSAQGGEMVEPVGKVFRCEEKTRVVWGKLPIMDTWADLYLATPPATSGMKEAPVNCREAGPGKGFCDYCAAGMYERCRFLRPNDATDRGPNQDSLVGDAERLDWLERNLFERKWSGTIGRLPEHFIRGDYRHTTQNMHGETLRAGIDAAIRAGKKG